MATKTTKKIRCSQVKEEMVLATGVRIVKIVSKMVHTGWPAMPYCLVTLHLEDGGAAVYGSSEWVEVKR